MFPEGESALDEAWGSVGFQRPFQAGTAAGSIEPVVKDMGRGAWVIAGLPCPLSVPQCPHV